MEHRARTIASTSSCRIDRCSCGAIHLTVGGTTLRIPESQARELLAALGQSFAQIDASTTTAAAVTSGFPMRDSSDDGESGPPVH